MDFGTLGLNLRIGGLLALVAAITFSAAACDDDDDGTFPCGSHGGRCELDTEVCVLDDECASCVAVPSSCDDPTDCGCIGEADFSDDPEVACPVPEGRTCNRTSEGATLSCSAEDFGCG